LKLKYDKPLSKFAFKFNMRRYSMAVVLVPINAVEDLQESSRVNAARRAATMVGRCRLTLSNSR
jgi:hypothetical protein